MATYNRREVVLSSLQRLMSLRLERLGAEIIVVDNASADGSAEAIRERYADSTLLESCGTPVHVVDAGGNLGSCAKALGVDVARGRYVVFLDDDSFPRPGALERMVEHFRRDPRLGAAGFVAFLPDGRRESCALPEVFIGCGAGFRREALVEVCGLDRTLFMAAEEYDLAFRLTAAAWGVRNFADLHVDHLKSAGSRASDRLMYLDTRNNLYLLARYVPDDLAREYRADWLQRYCWFAEDAGLLEAYARGRADGLTAWAEQRATHARWRLSPADARRLFCVGAIGERMAELAERGVRRIVLADWGKNVYPFVAAAEELEMEVLAIVDDRFACTSEGGGTRAAGRRYRGVPIVPVRLLSLFDPDAVIVANTSPVHAEEAAARLANVTDVPVCRWFGFDRGGESEKVRKWECAQV